jgi:hypothetical protein
MARPYLTRNKAVFEIEYSTDENDQPRSQAVLNGLCTALANDGIQNGIIKSAELSSAYYMRCP